MREIYKVYQYTEINLEKIIEGLFVIPEIAGGLETAKAYVMENEGEYIIVKESREGENIKIKIMNKDILLGRCKA